MIFALSAKFKLVNLIIIIPLMWITGVSLCHAQQSDHQDTALSENVLQPSEHIFNLQHKQRFFYFNISCHSINKVKFEKEPDFGRRNIVRGLIPLGSDKKNYIGFAWDRVNKKLHVDLNRNKDLTDDPNGIFESKGSSSFQYFRDIHLTLQKGALILPYTIEMRMYSYGRNHTSCSATIHSGYSAEIELDGRRWHVGIVDNMNGSISSGDHFFLSPLDRDFPAGRNSQELRVPRSIFLDSHNYDVSFEFQQGMNTPILQLRLKESEKPMGKLKIDGEHIARLVLESGSSTVLLHYPQQSVSIPTEDYHCSGVYLYNKDAGLYQLERIFGIKKENISITEDGSTTLKAGGPLNNIVEIKRSGTTLNLNYKLIGIDNKSYTNLNSRRDKPPTFTIYKGSREIASDKFEYG
ncbi:MAG: hypothetical protein GY845_20475 [Planctomycetes bacterium]|nr:hypothetical protein [Planctomycetota bacterium]